MKYVLFRSKKTGGQKRIISLLFPGKPKNCQSFKLRLGSFRNTVWDLITLLLKPNQKFIALLHMEFGNFFFSIEIKMAE